MNTIELTKKTNFLQINEDRPGDLIIATGLLQEIANDSRAFSEYTSRFSGILNHGEEFVVNIDDYCSMRSLYCAHDVAARRGFTVGVVFTFEGISTLTVYTAAKEKIAILNWFDWSMTSQRHNRIDMTHGGFGRMGLLLANIASHIIADGERESGLATLYEILPGFDLTKFCADELERRKRAPFLRDLQNSLRKRNTIDTAAAPLRRLDGLLVALLDIVHSFEIYDEANLVKIQIRDADGVYGLELPLGILMPFSAPHLVKNEIAILKKLNANKPLL